MATTFDLTVGCEPMDRRRAEETLSECHRILARLETDLSEYLFESPIYKLNHLPAKARVAVSKSTLRLLEASERLRLETGGAFDCTAKSDASAPPAGTRMGWDSELAEMWRTHEAVRVGFGAIGKGFALDEIRSHLEREGFTHYLLSGGGSSLLLSGFASPYDPWRWGWSWEKPTEGEETSGIAFRHSTGLPVALGISGRQEKGDHLIDPTSRGPINGKSVKSALIGHTRATDADALSTALFVGGWEEATLRMEKLDVTPAMAVIDDEGVAHWNGIFQRLWGNPSGTAGIAAFFLFVISVTWALPSLAQDAVDLSSMGMEDFTPYLFDRDPRWILLPALSLALVFLHLKRSKKLKPRIASVETKQ